MLFRYSDFCGIVGDGIIPKVSQTQVVFSIRNVLIFFSSIFIVFVSCTPAWTMPKFDHILTLEINQSTVKFTFYSNRKLLGY